jgi:hypothetical protein
VRCNGADPKCELCEGLGYHKITSCPHNEISGDVKTFLKLYNIAENGTMPVDGGTLNQTQSFIDAMNYLAWYESDTQLKLWQKNA